MIDSIGMKRISGTVTPAKKFFEKCEKNVTKVEFLRVDR